MVSFIRSRLLAGSMTFMCVFAPSAATSETLAETLVSAYEHSGLLEQNRALLRAADEDVAQIVASLRPILNWSADITRDFGTVNSSLVSTTSGSTLFGIGLTLDLLIFDFGTTRFQLDAAKETVLATRQTLRSIEQQILLRAVAAFFNVNRSIEFVDLRQNNLRVLQEELRAARDRFEVGEVTRTDVAQAEARVASARSGLAVAQGDLAQAREEFRAAVGRPPGNLVTSNRLPNLSADVDAAKSVANRNHPDIKQAQREVTAAELTVLAADAAMKPTVNFTSRFGLTEEFGASDDTRSGTFGLSVTGPIYQGGLLSSAKRQAMARRDAARGNLHEVIHQIALDVGNSYAILRASQAVQVSSREEVRAAEVAFNGVREEATLGARTTLDVLDAEQDLLDARANQISADIDVFIAAYQVLASIGQLTAKDLNLPVQLYDPAAYYNLVKDAPVPISPQGKQLDRVLEAIGKSSQQRKH
ncbi:MAG: TolC family outer membrane protein [Pseudomonadota bacterium]